MNSNSEVHSRVRAFLVNQFPLARQAALNDNESLVESGVIDSMGVLELVTFIESDFEIVLSDEDVVADNFDSIATITSFIEEKLAIASGG